LGKYSLLLVMLDVSVSSMLEEELIESILIAPGAI